MIGFTGPGRWSLDHALGLIEWTGWTGAAWGVAVLAVGLAAAGAPLARRGQALRRRRPGR